MSTTKQVHLVLVTFISLLLLNGFAQEFCPNNQNIKCLAQNETDIDGITVTWPDTRSGRIAFSSPYCLDENKNPLIRTCCNGLWGHLSNKGCSFYAQHFDTKCPKNYTEIYISPERILCISVTTPQYWAPTCVDSGTQISVLDLLESEKEKVFGYLYDRKIEQVWLPARRGSRYEPLVWNLPGWKWQKPINFKDYFAEFYGDNLNVDGNCLKLVLGTNVFIAMDDCKQNLPYLCVFDNKLLMDDGVCATTRYKSLQNKCFTVEKLNENLRSGENINKSELFDANSIEKLMIFDEISQKYNLTETDKCLVNFDTRNVTDINRPWTVLSNLGKWGKSEYFNCIVNEKNRSNSQLPQISLKSDRSRGKLFLTIYSGENFWREDNRTAGLKCFTDNDSEMVKTIKVKRKIWSGKYKLGQIEVSKDIYDIKLTGNGIGHYWCEGHALPNFTLIKTEKVIASKLTKGLTYAALIDVKINNSSDLTKDKKSFKRFSKDYLHHLRQFNNNGDPAVIQLIHHVSAIQTMLVESVSTETQYARVLVHIILAVNSTVIQSIMGVHGQLNHFSREIPSYIQEYYQIKFHLENALVKSNSENFTFISLNSTEYCLPTVEMTQDKFHWVGSHIGERTLSNELCLQPTGLPLARKCVGNHVYGGAWEIMDFSTLNCLPSANISEITKTLFDADRKPMSFDVAHQTMGSMSEMTTNATLLIPSDIYLLSKTLQTFSNLKLDNETQASEAAIDITYYDNLMHIMNNIMLANETVVKESTTSLNATNILLDSVNNLINQFPTLITTDSLNNNVNVYDVNDGTMLLITSKFIVFIADPSVKNISGIALVKKNSSDGVNDIGFEQYEIRKISSNETVTNLLSVKGLELATYAPQELIDRIDEIDLLLQDLMLQEAKNTSQIIADTPETKENKFNVVITIYFNDKLFIEVPSKQTQQKSNSKIISVSFPGHGNDLPVLLPTIYRAEANNTDMSSKCGYWDFDTGKIESYGHWSTQGCEYLSASVDDPEVIACGCTHLTHFAYLVMGKQYITLDEEYVSHEAKIHTEALDIITFIGSTLSLLGILGIIVTAIAFKSWRERPGTKVLLHLSAAIALQMVLIAFINTETLSKKLIESDGIYNCVFLGALMHYSILVAFAWMLITAVLQFMRYVKVIGDTRPPRFLLKSALVGWVLPLIPVFITAMVSPKSYVPPVEAIVPGICYPKGNALYFGLLLPVSLIIALNLIIFVMVIYNIFKIPDVHIRTNERDLLVSQLRLSINLFFLLGLSWIFGFATISKAGIVFSYLFCLTATLQGFVLFVYFIIMDPTTRKFWQLLLSNVGINCGKRVKDLE